MRLWRDAGKVRSQPGHLSADESQAVDRLLAGRLSVPAVSREHGREHGRQLFQGRLELLLSMTSLAVKITVDEVVLAARLSC